MKLSKTWILNEVYPVLKQSARVIDLYRFEQLFQLESTVDLEKELRQMQNDDGGFWSCLEPDTRSKHSSVIGTCRALDYYEVLEYIPSEPKVLLEQYLRKTFDKLHQKWSILSGDIWDAPCAIWWNKEFESTFSHINPTAELLGFIRHFALEVEVDVIGLSEKLLNQSTDNMHDYLALQKMARLMGNPYDSRIVSLGESLIHWESEKWEEYSLGPIDVIHSPNHPLYPKYQIQVEEHMEHLMNVLQQNKGIHPLWKWGQFEEFFKDADNDWTGKLTVDFLKKLMQFQKID